MTRPSSFRDVDWQTWQLALDTYAMQLFNDERNQNPLIRIDQSPRWHEVTKEDRAIYRELALKLISETTPREFT